MKEMLKQCLRTEYTLADVGEHTYTVKCNSVKDSCMSIDTNVYTVTVTIRDEGNGNLLVTASENYNDLDFENACHADLNHIEAKVATCTTSGNREYWSCSCGRYFSDKNAVNEIQKDSWIIAPLFRMCNRFAGFPAK